MVSSWGVIKKKASYLFAMLNRANLGPPLRGYRLSCFLRLWGMVCHCSAYNSRHKALSVDIADHCLHTVGIVQLSSRIGSLRKMDMTISFGST